jgi:hypothetical protein
MAIFLGQRQDRTGQGEEEGMIALVRFHHSYIASVGSGENERRRGRRMNESVGWCLKERGFSIFSRGRKGREGEGRDEVQGQGTIFSKVKFLSREKHKSSSSAPGPLSQTVAE